MSRAINRDAPYSGLSSLMAMRGRKGDTELVHMSKPELQGLASLGKLTINPDTGLPEAFKLGSLLPTIAGLAAAAYTGGSSLLIPALATGATSAAVHGDVGRGLFDGILSYAGGSIMQGLSGGEAAAGAISPVSGPNVSMPLTDAGTTAAGDSVSSAMNTIAQGSSPTGLGDGVSNLQVDVGEVPWLAGQSPPSYVANAPIKESLFNKAYRAGEAVPVQMATKLGVPGANVSGLSAMDQAKYFAPQAAAGLGSTLLAEGLTPQQYDASKDAEEKKKAFEPETRTMTRINKRDGPVSPMEALAAAEGSGKPLRFFDYKYAKQGGLLSLADGGMLPNNQADAASNILKYMIEGRAAEDRQKLTQVEEPAIVADDDAAKEEAKAPPLTKQQEEQQQQDSEFLIGGSGSDSSGDGSVGDVGDFAAGGLMSLKNKGGYFQGHVPGDEHGMKDNVAFKVKGGNIDMAMLSPGEYVIPADVVAMLGNGNGNSGAKELDLFAKAIRKKAFGTHKQQRQLNAKKELKSLMR